jgi:hypothetical protein
MISRERRAQGNDGVFTCDGRPPYFVPTDELVSLSPHLLVSCEHDALTLFNATKGLFAVSMSEFWRAGVSTREA